MASTGPAATSPRHADPTKLEESFSDRSAAFPRLALACGSPPLEQNSGEGDVNASTTLHIHYPGTGHAITVRGSSSGTLSWSSSAAASSQDDQTWTVTVSKAKGTLQFKPLLDDRSWSIGPNYAVKAGSSVEVWPHFHAVSGTVNRIDGWYSNGLANRRPVYVYPPPSCAEQTGEAFPVIYMHDGQNLFDAYTKALAAAYRSAGYPSVDSQVGNGDQHEEAAWSRRLPGALAYLLGNRGARP